MEDKVEGKKLEKIATRESIVTDQGNGGSYCSNCKEDLSNNYNDDICPGCGYKLVEGSMYIPRGGSDF